MSINQAEILIIDDTIANLEVLTVILQRQGYRVRAAPNGRGGLRTAQSSAPDLILLDIQMPEIDGYQVCQELQKDSKTRHVPVIFISALDDVFDKVKAFEAGAVDYINKPFQIEEVLARVRSHLQLSIYRQKLHSLENCLRDFEAGLEDLEADAVDTSALQAALSNMKAIFQED